MSQRRKATLEKERRPWRRKGDPGEGKATLEKERRPWRRQFSRRSCRDSNQPHFDHEAGALTTELSPLLKYIDSLIKE